MLNAIQNRLRHRIGMSQDFVVPESQHAIAASLQPATTIHVVRDLLCVLAAIDFDNHPALETHKVHDERADGLLPAKLHAGELTALELLPQALLGFGQGLRSVLARSVSMSPDPSLPPQRGEGASYTAFCVCVSTRANPGRISFVSVARIVRIRPEKTRDRNRNPIYGHTQPRLARPRPPQTRLLLL